MRVTCFGADVPNDRREDALRGALQEIVDQDARPALTSSPTFRLYFLIFEAAGRFQKKIMDLPFFRRFKKALWLAGSGVCRAKTLANACLGFQMVVIRERQTFRERNYKA